MFQRNFRVKSNTATKGSDRKKLKRQLQLGYPHVPQTKIDNILSNRVTMATLKVMTHSGTSVTVLSVDNEPLFCEDDSGLYPTVYTLWQIPEMIRCVATWPRVLPKLQGGADLMLPGVVTAEKGGCELEGIRRGELCAVNLVGNRTAIGVGVALLSYDQMIANGMRGKGFRMLHLYGDHLWEMGSKCHPPLISVSMEIASAPMTAETLGVAKVSPMEPPTGVQRTNLTHDSSPSLSDTVIDQHDSKGTLKEEDAAEVSPEGLINPSNTVTGSKLVDDDDPLSFDALLDPLAIQESSDSETETAKTELDYLEQQTCISLETGHDSGPAYRPLAVVDALSEGLGDELPTTHDAGGVEAKVEELVLRGAEAEGGALARVLDDPTKVMDELLLECFLQALKSQLKTIDIPLLTSTFYRSYMLDQCPTSQKLDIKKSSYKKLSRFLATMCSEGILQVEELSKGVESITKVDFKHPLIKRFVPKLLPERSRDQAEITPTTHVAAIKVALLYMPSHLLLPVFKSCGHSKASILDQSAVRETITSYVKTRELVSQDNPRMVVLDDVLCGAVRRKGESPHTQLSWQQLMERVLEVMRPAYSISDSYGNSRTVRGSLEPVRLTLVQRMGNKKVTLVDNLDRYGIPPMELAQTMQRVAAASSTVVNVSGNPECHQVLVQGNAVKIIARVLQENYGLPLKHIEASDKTKAPKKKRKK